jgi:hypothetical protein
MKDPLIEVQFNTMKQASARGGVFVIKSFAQDYGLWERVRAEASLDPRKQKGKGYDPVVYVATFLFGFTSGGTNMADFERLNAEEGLKEFLGIKNFPDQTTQGQWLRSIGIEGAKALWRINRDFISWVVGQTDPARLLHCGDLEVFFDDTQLEVTGKLFEAAALNYEGKTTLSWQTTWVGPFLAAGDLGTGSRDCSVMLPAQLEQCKGLWEGRNSYLYADSGSSAGKYLEAIEQGVDRFSVSYNKWLEGLERCASELAPMQWGPEQTVDWRDGKKHIAQHAWMHYQPDGCACPKLFAVTRHRLAEGELFWRYAFICCESGRQGSLELAIGRHQLKGDKERLFSQVLSDLDLHHPPCHDLGANNAFYALGAMAHNLLHAIKLLHLKDQDQALRTRSLIQILMLVPVQFKRHARRVKAVCCVASTCLGWWRKFIGRLLDGGSKYFITPPPG